MNVTLNLPPDVEAGLLAQAQAEGLAVSEYVQNLVRGQLAVRSGTGAKPRPSYELPPKNGCANSRHGRKAMQLSICRSSPMKLSAGSPFTRTVACSGDSGRYQHPSAFHSSAAPALRLG